MGDKRNYLEPGMKLYFENEVCVEIEEIIGSGGTALTYYGKELIEEQEPVRVLLKELYPRSADFSRDGAGRIVVDNPEAEYIYHTLADALYHEQELGNQIVQKKIVGLYPMKQVLKEQNTGNYYGLFYQCPSSITLRAFVEKYGSRMSLWGKLKVIQALCRLIRSMHEQGGYCHNDISGGNVIIISNALLQAEYLDWSAIEQELQVGLIDFACGAKLNQWDEAELPDVSEPMRFHTDGFSAPELYELDGRYITVQADVYSVTACLWYLLTGRVLETENGYPVLGKQEWESLKVCLREHEFCSLSENVRAAFDEKFNSVPEEVSNKITYLLKYGLEKCQNRFRNMGILEDRIQEILDFAEGTSVSDSSLEKQLRETFRINRVDLRKRYEIREMLLPVATKPGVKEESSLLNMFLSGKSVYAIGPGGVGKTTTMFRAAEALFNDDGNVIPVYLELNRLPMWKKESGVHSKAYWLGNDERPTFIEQYLAGIYYGSHGTLIDRNNLVVGALRRQIESGDPDSMKYRIFMDGLNEMAFSDHEEKQAFISAINWYLTYGANISLVLTSRYDEGLIDDEIQRVQVKGLTEESVEACLREEMNNGRITGADYETVMSMDHNSNLWKCLQLPLFLAMYCHIEDKRKLQSAGEILQAYFRGKGKKLDGSQQYSETAISEEKYMGVQFAEGLSMEHARRLIIDFLLPSLGYSMMYLHVFFFEKRAAERILSRYLDDKCMPSVVNRYGYTFDVERALQIMKAVGPERILSFICENMGILAQESGGSYFFPHQYYRDYFAANKMIQMFCEATELFTRNEVDHEEAILIEDMIDTFAARKIPESVLMLCGECLGVHRTIPEYQADGWKIPEPWDPLVDSMLEFCRIPKQNDTDLTVWQANIKHRFLQNTSYFEYNMFNMLCLCRKRGKRADLSGIDFHGISLEKCPVEHVIFSHPQGKDGIYADLRDTGYISALRRSRRTPSMRFFGEDLRNGCKKEHVFMHPEGNWALVMEEKEEFSSLSHTSEFKTHLEEREILGDEIRPIGYWDKINALCYRDDGRFLAIIETVTNASTYMMEELNFFEKVDMNHVEMIRNIYIYDRKEGKKYYSRLSPVSIETIGTFNSGVIESCRWIGDVFIILHISADHSKLVHTVIRLEDGQLMQNHTVINMAFSVYHGQYKVLDEERILVYYQEYGMIYHIHTRQTLWFTIKSEWRCCAIDTDKKCIYAFTRSGGVERIDTRSGERSVIREAGIFATIEQLTIEKDKIFFIEGDHLYQTDHTFREIRFIRQILREDSISENRILSVGKNHAVTDSSGVFRISDGTIVRRWDQKAETLSHPLRIWVHPKKSSVRLSILDQGNKVLYHLGLAEDQSLTCSSYRLIELNDEFVYAIYVDYEQGQLLTCEENRICCYDLHSGKKLDQISELNLAPYSIESVAFAPGGKSLEIRAVHSRLFELTVLRKECFFHVDCQNGTYSEHLASGERGRIVRYKFAFEDIESGYDSGKRSPVFEHDEDWHMDKSMLKDCQDSDYNSSLRSLLPKKLVSLIARIDMSTPSEMELFEHGPNRCVARKEGCFYWDAAKKRWYRFQGKYGEIETWSDCDQYDQDTYPFEDGFIRMEDGTLKRFVEDHKQRIMEQWNWDPGSVRYTLGCPGTESIQYKSWKSTEEVASDEW